MIDFSIPPEVEDLRLRTQAFIAEVVIPAEEQLGSTMLGEELRHELHRAAQAAGVFAPQAPVEFGGLGLDVRGWSVVMEEAGYSTLGPHALNCAAPDEGNMRMLELIASPAQREAYLAPLCRGEVRSAFAMTEPHPGAGADPAMLQTTAEKVDGGWSINGLKRFTTGADGAAFTICMAKTGDAISGDSGATMFIVEQGNPGVELVRRIHTSDTVMPGGHAVVKYTDCFVPDDAVLGEVGLGYRYAQVRLGPARLTHCIRWLGLARRSLDIALDRAAERELFGKPLIEHGMVQQFVADSVIDIEASRQLNRLAAWAIDTGQPGRHETSIAKVFVAEAVHRVIDRAVQICGGDGVSDDLPLDRYLGEVRPFRIYDGPSEVHRWSIARRAARRREAARG